MENNQEKGGNEPGWPIRICTVIGGGTGMTLGFLVLKLTGVSGFWPGLIVSMLGVILGGVLGKLAGSHLFGGPQA